MEIALTRTTLLAEAVTGGNFQAIDVAAITGGYDPPQDDYVHKLWQWRNSCPNYDDASHGAYCPRCDEVWRMPQGGALWIARTDWKVEPERAGSDGEIRGGPSLLTTLQSSGSVLRIDGSRGSVPRLNQTTSQPAQTTVMPEFWGTSSPQRMTTDSLSPHWKEKSRTLRALSQTSKVST